MISVLVNLLCLHDDAYIWHAVSDAMDVHMQVSLPIIKVDGCPVGLSLMGPQGSDESLLQLTEKLMAVLLSDTR